MADQLQIQLKEVGSKLENPPASKDALLKLLTVTEGRTWLADESALSHFASLILEANGSVPSKLNDVDTVKDSERDGNEVPLGKMYKCRKAKGSKARKAVKKDSTPAVVETENNVDILGMLREINLDNVGVSTKFDSSNGHGKITSDAKLKRKNLSNDLTNVSVPKRQRSSSAKGHKKSSFNNFRMEDKGRIHVEETRRTDNIDLEKPKKSIEIGSNQKSGAVTVKKPKRRRVSGLAKKDLIGRRIRVWWPLDEMFYGGVVKSYDHEKKKHEVLYDDGDIEVLYLPHHRWELIEDGHKPIQRKLLSNSPPPKGGNCQTAPQLEMLDSGTPRERGIFPFPSLITQFCMTAGVPRIDRIPAAPPLDSRTYKAQLTAARTQDTREALERKEMQIRGHVDDVDADNVDYGPNDPKPRNRPQQTEDRSDWPPWAITLDSRMQEGFAELRRLIIEGPPPPADQAHPLGHQRGG